MISTEARTRLPQSMKDGEYERIQLLLEQNRPENTLEVGFANGGSAVIICKYLRKQGKGRHTAIDPFQSDPNGLNGFGLNRVREAGYSDLLEFHEDFDYLALPKLVKDKRRFDFILLDGWHSFDYTMIDFFFADLLLNPKGILVFHDTAWASVNRVCKFVETHKPYERVSPPLYLQRESVPGRLRNRVEEIISGPSGIKAANERRKNWFSLAVYRKLEDHQVPNMFSAPF